MRYKKNSVCFVGLAMLLVAGVFFNGIFAEVCFCGRKCNHGVQEPLKPRNGFPLFHIHCSGTICKSCDMEDGKAFKAFASKSQVTDVKDLCPPVFISSVTQYAPLNFPDFRNSFFLYECKTVPSPSIFLQKNSWLC